MKRAILIDGNNLLFRSYYATAYSGSLMRNSSGFPTNALFGFVNMMNKIVNEENPEYIVVAFDKGKNFRHEKYKDYKAGRIETPKDLLVQFPKAYEVLDAMGIKWVSCDNYEADDIIGTFAKMADIDKEYDATIVSSDKDLLQLISSDVNVKLLKQKDYILMDEKVFFDTYGLKPVRMVDLKALMGDASDNIPGVKGIGEKTALNILHEFDTIENLYDNIDKVKGKTKEKLILGKESAFFSKEMATIYKDVPINLTFEDIKFNGFNIEKLTKLYREFEFYSFIKKLETFVNKVEGQLELDFSSKREVEANIMPYIRVKEKLNIDKEFAFYLEVSRENYHMAKPIYLVLEYMNQYYVLDEEAIILNKDIFTYATSTYDAKKSICFLERYGIKLNNLKYDTMIASYLLNQNTKDDIAYLANTKGYNIMFYETMIKDENVIVLDDILINNLISKVKFIANTKSEFLSLLKSENSLELYENIEIPLIPVLARMEMNGIRVSLSELDNIREDLESRITNVEEEIFLLAGERFNILSSKQTGAILFEKMGMPYKKRKSEENYKTDHDTLMKYYDMSPIIELILEYRNLSKLINTYMESLKRFVLDDGKIHTIFKQAVTRTGRLSCTEPNLQNIPIRAEDGKRIRKAFLPNPGDVILTSDYSQIELRLLAHISKDEALINAFKSHEDIHTKVASDIYGIPISEVTKNQRRTAKAVIFGIVYGISGFGLGENLSLSSKEAKVYIDKYLSMYPGVKAYMEEIVKKAKDDGYVTTIFGRRRVIEELNNTNYMIRKSGERMALNTPVQGSSADIIKKAMIEIDNEIIKRGLNTKMLIQVHDELVFSVPKSELVLVKELVANVMENTYKILVPLKVEEEIGDNWYDAK